MPTEMSKRSVKDVWENAHSNFVHNSPKLKVIQKAINRVNELWYIYTMEYHKTIKKNDLQLHTITDSRNIK